MDEICAYARPSNQVDESKSTRPHRFRFMLGKMQEHSEANQRWNVQLEEFQQSNSDRELFGIDGEPIVFGFSQDLHHCRFFQKDPKISARSKL